MQVKLQSAANKGKTVKTMWGPVTFDADGAGTHDVPDSDLLLFRTLGWVVEEPPPVVADTNDDEDNMTNTVTRPKPGKRHK